MEPKPSLALTARIDRERFDCCTFPVSIDIPIRFDDLDMQGHVNNAAGMVLLQEARAAFNRHAGMQALIGNLRTMVASQHVEYAGEMRHPGSVEISTGVLAVGRSSFTLGQVARQDGRARLYVQTVMVVAGADGPTPIPADLRAAYQRFLLDG